MLSRTPTIVLLVALATTAAARADEQVDALLAPLAQPRAKADALIAGHTVEYVAALAKLEPDLAAQTGNLDAVLLLRKEVEEWKAGRPTPSFAPDDPSVPEILRARREAFDHRRAEAEAIYLAAVRKEGPQIIAALDQLAQEAARTKGRRAIRRAADDLRDALAAAAALAPGAGKPAPGPPANAPGAAPDAPAPLLGGSLHAFGVDNQGQPVDLSAAKRFSDFVSVTARQGGRWAAVRANGDLVSNIPRLAKEKIGDVARCEFTAGALVDVLVLHRDGKVSAFGQNASDAPRGLRSVTDVGITDDLAFAVRTDGGLEAWAAVRGEPGTDLDREARRLAAALGGVVAVGGCGPKTGFVLGDGTVRFRGARTAINEPVPSLSGIADIVLGHFWFLALTREGELRCADYARPEKDLLPPDLRGLKFTAVKGGGNAFAARNANGSWTAWGNSETSGVPEKINSLGPVVDLAFDTSYRKSAAQGLVIWIR